MNRADRESLFPNQGIEQRRLARADTTKNRNVQMPVLDLVEHCLHCLVVVNQRFTDAVGKPRIVNKLAQTLAREPEVVAARRRLGVSLSFRPGPFWQRGERPLPNAH